MREWVALPTPDGDALARHQEGQAPAYTDNQDIVWDEWQQFRQPVRVERADVAGRDGPFARLLVSRVACVAVLAAHQAGRTMVVWTSCEKIGRGEHAVI